MDIFHRNNQLCQSNPIGIHSETFEVRIHSNILLGVGEAFKSAETQSHKIQVKSTHLNDEHTYISSTKEGILRWGHSLELEFERNIFKSEFLELSVVVFGSVNSKLEKVGQILVENPQINYQQIYFDFWPHDFGLLWKVGTKVESIPL